MLSLTACRSLPMFSIILASSDASFSSMMLLMMLLILSSAVSFVEVFASISDFLTLVSSLETSVKKSEIGMEGR